MSGHSDQAFIAAAPIAFIGGAIAAAGIAAITNWSVRRCGFFGALVFAVIMIVSLLAGSR